jgi:hypothetical protein
MNMKLFYWTEHEWDVCGHHAVFADNEWTAKTLVVEGIKKSWEPKENDPDPDWSINHMAMELESFLFDPKWKLTVHDIVPGILDLK